MARRRNEEAGDFGAEIKHSDKACVCETSDLGKPYLDIAWLAGAFLVYNLSLGWSARLNLTHVSQFSFLKAMPPRVQRLREERKGRPRSFRTFNPHDSISGPIEFSVCCIKINNICWLVDGLGWRK